MTAGATDTDFADELDTNLTWRIRELSDLKSAIRATRADARPVLLRSLVTMLYAHWEGHIKFCAFKYFDYLTSRRLKFRQLEKQLYVNHFLLRPEIAEIGRKPIADRCRFIDEVLSSREHRFARTNPKLINAQNNLRSHVILEICRICAVDDSLFQAEANFIDKILCDRRNAIAHGSAEPIGIGELDMLVDKAIALMRAFKDQILNKIYTRSYLV